MDIRQVQNEIAAIDLQVKYEPIIDAIMTLTDGIDVMSMDARKNWISAHSLRIGQLLFFADIFIDGTKSMGDGILGLQNDSLGRILCKTYSPNDIIYACTYFEFLSVGKNSETKRGIIIYGNPPILKEERKMQTDEVGINFKETLISEKAVVEGLSYQDIKATNCRVQIIKKSSYDDENLQNLKPIMDKEALEEFIRVQTPEFILTGMSNKVEIQNNLKMLRYDMSVFLKDD